MKLWIRVDAAIRSDPNIAELADRLSIPFAEAVGLCTLVWCAIAEHCPSGTLGDISIAQLERWSGYTKRRGHPAGEFGKAFLDLFVSDGQASGWHDRQGKLVERMEKDRARKRRGDSEETPRKTAATERNETERNVVPSQEKDQSGEVKDAAPRFPLPHEATQFLATFYEPAFTEAARKRYRDVLGQICDTLDPKHPGPKIRGGIRVKARSPEHLIDTLNAVRKDPPRDRDLAIVWLLKKLTDAPKGPAVTDLKKKAEASDRARDESYQRAAKKAGIEWAEKHPDEYKKIAASVETTYKSRGGSFAQIAKEAELTQRCSKAAGFPTFEEWCESHPRRAEALIA